MQKQRQPPGRKRGGNERHRRWKITPAIALIIGMEVLGMGMSLYSLYHDVWHFDAQLPRNPAGEGDYTEDLEVVSPYYTGDITVDVAEQVLDADEAEQLFDRAFQEIQEEFLGTNPDFEHVTNDVVVRDAYQDGMVAAEWSFDRTTLVTSEGCLRKDRITETELVQATVLLSYDLYERIETFPFCVMPQSIQTQEGFQRKVQSLLEEQKEQERMLQLPVEVGGESLQWRRKFSYQGLGLSLLGVLTLLLLPYAKKMEFKRQRVQRQKEMSADYPVIVSQLSLLLGTGVSLEEAAERMTLRYQQQKEKTKKMRAGFELWSQFSREIQDGVGEWSAIEHLGSRSGIREYRKLSMLLHQNQIKGNEHLVEQLEQEDFIAFEAQKQRAKKAGEEASTKLLFPMMGMLAIIVVILLMPAVLTMGGI